MVKFTSFATLVAVSQLVIYFPSLNVFPTDFTPSDEPKSEPKSNFEGVAANVAQNEFALKSDSDFYERFGPGVRAAMAKHVNELYNGDEDVDDDEHDSDSDDDSSSEKTFTIRINTGLSDAAEHVTINPIFP